MGDSKAWLDRFRQAFAQPVERLKDVEPTLLGMPANFPMPGSSTQNSVSSPSQNDSARLRAPTSDDESAAVGQYYLPGLGVTFLNPQFADRVGDFILAAKSRGTDVSFRSAYRTQASQDALHSDPTATTPAKKSLHSEGWAVDVHIPWLPNGQVDRSKMSALVADAAKAGLKWGGSFGDPGHFYYDPGGDRVQAIARFSRSMDKFNQRIRDY